MEEIISILSLIPNVFDPSTYFARERKNEEKEGHIPSNSELKPLYFFKGMICFWGKHYFAYFRDFHSDNSADCWSLYDDNRVKKVGDWDDVLEKCLDGSERPILLIYEILKNKSQQHTATNDHYLNDLIGAK